MGINIDEKNQTEIIPVVIKRALTMFCVGDLYPTFAS